MIVVNWEGEDKLELSERVLHAIEWMTQASLSEEAAAAAGFSPRDAMLVNNGLLKGLAVIVALLAHDAGVPVDEFIAQSEIPTELHAGMSPPDIMIQILLAGARLK